MYQVIATGSKGNAVLYHGVILVDIGIPFALIKPHLRAIQLVLLTHEHKDHINAATLQKLAAERPSLRVGCCDWMLPHLPEFRARNVDVYRVGEVYNYSLFQISPIKLYHDVPNCGYRIFKGNTKILHATDTAHLEGIEARGYDLYSIEHNYDEDTVMQSIAALEARGEFAHQRGAMNSHLSEQQAQDFIFKNKADHSKVLRLHETSTL